MDLNPFLLQSLLFHPPLYTVHMLPQLDQQVQGMVQNGWDWAIIQKETCCLQRCSENCYS